MITNFEDTLGILDGYEMGSQKENEPTLFIYVSPVPLMKPVFVANLKYLKNGNKKSIECPEILEKVEEIIEWAKEELYIRCIDYTILNTHVYTNTENKRIKIEA